MNHNIKKIYSILENRGIKFNFCTHTGLGAHELSLMLSVNSGTTSTEVYLFPSRRNY